jgi:ribosomal-protein-alanine acetyltransferase
LENLRDDIREAVPADLPAIIALAKNAVIAAQWSVEQYDAIFRAGSTYRIALVAVEKSRHDEPRVQGFIVAQAIAGEWEIENIAVDTSVKRRGLGKRLLAHLLEIARAKGAKSIFLEVRESNSIARSFYENASFSQGGRRKRYYENPKEDAILYRRELG